MFLSLQNPLISHQKWIENLSIFLLLSTCCPVLSHTTNPKKTINTQYIYQPTKKPTHVNPLTPQEYLHHLSQSWDSMSTLQADLLQKNPNGTEMKAKLYLRRPGEMRLIYDAPSQVQMIALQGKLIHYDGRRNSSQSMDLSRSPVAFLLQGKLHEQVQLVAMIHTPPLITLVMKIKKDPRGPKFGLTFDRVTLFKNPKACPLTGWFMMDAYGKTTTITLSKVQKNVGIEKGTFELKKK